jgi:hypothetical protein
MLGFLFGFGIGFCLSAKGTGSQKNNNTTDANKFMASFWEEIQKPNYGRIASALFNGTWQTIKGDEEPKK